MSTYCMVTVRYPKNLGRYIEQIQSLNGQYYGVKSEEVLRKRQELNQPFYINPENDAIYQYPSDYPRNLV